ncbi:MAG: class I SAM-dependent methyltransferase [Candidatus Amesbacteria bacterium]|nr:class I SAM-dependent methyltransferase [Candidatus Amesbacteria bacterium]
MANENQFKLFTKFIATRGVEEYRQTIPIWVRPEDSILEIGCEWGTTSNQIWQGCKSLIATDISLDCISVARIKYPQIRFETLDAFNIQQAMRFGTNFTKIYIDMSGLSSYRALLDVISLLNMYASVFGPEAIIIKSGSLKQFARNCSVWKSL